MSSTVASEAALLLAGRRRRAKRILCGLAVLLCMAVTAAVCCGAVAIAPAQVAAILLQGLGIDAPWEFERQHQTIVMNLRLPRIVLGMAVGAALAVAGATLQGLFRNPLADPALIGVSAGAALAAIALIVLGHGMIMATPEPARPYLLPLFAFLGGALAAALVYRIGLVNGRAMMLTVLLAGIAVNAICNALMGFLIFISNDQQLRDLIFWTMGSFSRNTWQLTLPILPFLLVPLIGLPFLSRAMNAYSLGESEAGYLGYDAGRLVKIAITLTAMAIGAAVALTGIIAFLGLVVPHLARLLLGADHRHVLPASMLLGATLALVADLASRIIIAPAELPIGVVTSCIGGPFFLWLLLNRRTTRAFR